MAINKVKIIVVTITILLLSFFGVGSFLYFGYMSEGNRAGVVIKVSHKGYFFKTWEGEININDQGNTIKKFKFSVENDQTKVIEDLKNVALTGERISVTYIERHTTFFWRGDTKYFITEVVRQKKVDLENNINESLETPSDQDDNKVNTEDTETNENEESVVRDAVLSKETSL